MKAHTLAHTVCLLPYFMIEEPDGRFKNRRDVDIANVDSVELREKDI